MFKPCWKNYITVPLCSKKRCVFQENERGFSNNSKQLRAAQGVYLNPCDRHKAWPSYAPLTRGSVAKCGWCGRTAENSLLCSSPTETMWASWKERATWKSLLRGLRMLWAVPRPVFRRPCAWRSRLPTLPWKVLRRPSSPRDLTAMITGTAAALCTRREPSVLLSPTCGSQIRIAIWAIFW